MPVCSPTVYFIQDNPPEGPVKIGYTSRAIHARVAEGQTFHANALTVLAETYGTRKDESALHRRFAHLRIRGEMFLYNAEIRDLVMHLIEGNNLQSWLYC